MTLAANWRLCIRGGAQEATMRDICNPKLLYVKGALLLLTGLMAAGLIILERPTLKTAALLAIAVWAFARAYYFAFYVVEHYIDGEYRYSGLWSFARHTLTRQKKSPPDN